MCCGSQLGGGCELATSEWHVICVLWFIAGRWLWAGNDVWYHLCWWQGFIWPTRDRYWNNSGYVLHVKLLWPVTAVFCVEQLYSYHVCRNITVGSLNMHRWQRWNSDEHHVVPLWHCYDYGTVYKRSDLTDWPIDPPTHRPTYLLTFGTHCIVLLGTTVINDIVVICKLSLVLCDKHC